MVRDAAAARTTQRCVFPAVTAEASGRWSATRRNGYALAVVGEVVVAIALLASAGILAESGTDHSRAHTAVALAVLVVAAVIVAIVRRSSIASRAPVVGLALFAMAQLLESLGALGYGPDNDTRRSDLVVAHDIGLVATGITMLGLVVAVALSAGALIAGYFRPGIVPSLIVWDHRFWLVPRRTPCRWVLTESTRRAHTQRSREVSVEA